MPALLALFQRSLRELLRSRMSYAVLVSTVGLIFLFLLGAQANATATTAPGLRFFESSMVIELVFITLAGVSYFATAITEEKEEGTLALLRMTDLDPLAILLGKSTSRLTGTLLLLAATLPFTLLAITLGGVSARQVFASYLCVGAYLVLLANVALLASVLSPRGAIATLVTSLAVLGTPVSAWLLKGLPGWVARFPMGSRVAFLAPACGQVSELLQSVNPFRRLNVVLSTGFDSAMVDAQFGLSLLLALICLGLAWLFFDFATGDQRNWTVPRLVPRPGSRWQRFVPGRAWLISALSWKDYHFIHGGRLASVARWSGYGVIAALAGGLALFGGNLAGSASAAFWAVNWIFALELVLVGSRILRSELREQTLSSLAGLPLSMQHIILMKLDGARRALLPGFVWMVICAALLCAGGMLSAFGKAPASSTGIAVTSVILWCYFASQIWLLAHLAAFFSLKLKWGALPVSVAILFLANLVGAMFCIGIFVMPIVALTYVPQLRTTIYRQLEELAAAE